MASGKLWRPTTGSLAVRLYAARSVELAPYQDVSDQITEGFEASFIIFDRDIFTVEMEEIDQTVVQQTWIRGEKVYERQ
jgi:predicted amidohydrolase YtcJ